LPWIAGQQTEVVTHLRRIVLPTYDNGPWD
jgi:hypothetical protein